MLSLEEMPVNTYYLLILTINFSFHFKILVLFSKINILDFSPSNFRNKKKSMLTQREKFLYSQGDKFYQ